MNRHIIKPVHTGRFVSGVGVEGRYHCLLPAPRVVWIVAYSHRCNRCSVVCGVVVGAGFKPAPTGWEMVGLKPAPTGWDRSDSPTDTPLRFGQVTLAGYGRSLPKSTSCAWNRFTWLLVLSPSAAPRCVWIVAYSHRCNRSSAVCGVVVGAGFKPAPTPRAMSGLKPAPTGWVWSDVEPVRAQYARLGLERIPACASVVRGAVVEAGFKPAPTPRAMSGLKPALSIYANARVMDSYLPRTASGFSGSSCHRARLSAMYWRMRSNAASSRITCS